MMSLSESVKQVISDQWSFLVEATFEPTAPGSSYATYFVDTSYNQFVLKLYAATTETAQIHYEHSLLAFLQSTDLPFAIPVPICASSGETFIAIEADGRSLNAALFPRIVGQAMDRRNLAQIQAAGFALAKLHDRLANFDPQGKFARLPFWGALDRIHPQVSVPLNVPQILSLGLEEQRRFGLLLNEAIEAAPNLYATLPIQTIHADYITPNILIENDRVVGILDFEFATRDLRVFDYLSSLDQFASFPWKEVRFEEIVQAFSTGYRTCSSLTVAEMEAAISVWKLQRASSLVYWTGWLIEGKGSRQKIVDAVVETLRFEMWLESNQRRLLDALGVA
ncbi:phosphotransferase [Microcoleus sp. LAD1_D3]|uniref:phosphotransferase n=1 Tax=Microcoleus sp. LAD1_D3 TaxID=2819365 RepID=UPI002FCEEE8B